jgi:hypothetical protein
VGGRSFGEKEGAGTVSSARRSPFEQWHEAFGARIEAAEIAQPLKEASLAEELRTWTSLLTATVVTSCRDIGWSAAAKGHSLAVLPKAGQEYLNLDVMAFLPAPEAAKWRMPHAVFELENSQYDDRVAYSLWKVLCVRAELRVVFAFRPEWEGGRESIFAVGRDVMSSLTPHERSSIGGDTAIIMGCRGEGESFPWGFFKVWKLDVGLGRFEMIS